MRIPNLHLRTRRRVLHAQRLALRQRILPRLRVLLVLVRLGRLDVLRLVVRRLLRVEHGLRGVLRLLEEPECHEVGGCRGGRDGAGASLGGERFVGASGLVGSRRHRPGPRARRDGGEGEGEEPFRSAGAGLWVDHDEQVERDDEHVVVIGTVKLETDRYDHRAKAES